MCNIGFRVDASLEIGTGHVMRCLTLAGALRERGAKCAFVCRPHQGHLLDLIAQRGYLAWTLPPLLEEVSRSSSSTAHSDWLGTDWATDAADTQRVLSMNMGCEPLDWLVIDHYALEMRWEEALRPKSRRIMVIDDLADRPHACDLLLDQNLGRKEEDYCGLLKGKPTTLIGPQYALLRPKFAELRPQSLARRADISQLRHLLIAMGGVDKDNATGQVLDALKASALPVDLRITVVMGPQAPWKAQVKAQAAQMPWRTEVLSGVNNIEQLMANSDLAIGAAGGTAWERCCLGLPSIVLVMAENQLAGSVALQDAGAAIVLDTSNKIMELLSASKSKQLVDEVLTKSSRAAAAVTDGQGCARTADYIMEHVYV